MEIGRRIKHRRELLGMSQEELAKKVGYKSRSSINKIETDGRGLPQSKIVAFAKALETTPSYLMGWENPESDSEGQLTLFNTPMDDIEKVTIKEQMLIDSLRKLENENNNKCDFFYDIFLRILSAPETVQAEILDFAALKIAKNNFELQKAHKENTSKTIDMFSFFEQCAKLSKFSEINRKNNSDISETSMQHSANAARERTDVEPTEEMKKHDDDIMDDENF